MSNLDEALAAFRDHHSDPEKARAQARARIKERAATLRAKRERIARKAKARAKLAKVEAMARDTRCEPNTRAIAREMAARLRAKTPPPPDAARKVSAP